jgi:uncharacterized protein (DUF433 family)
MGFRTAALALKSHHSAKLCQNKVAMKATMVSRDPEIMSGAFCFTGTRVPVQNLFDYLEGSSSLDEFLEDFPSVQRETAVAVLEAARARLFADAAAAWRILAKSPSTLIAWTFGQDCSRNGVERNTEWQAFGARL